MKVPTNLNLRQTLEGMPLIFNPEASADLNAIIQFDVSGEEPGFYHLSITNGECRFQAGVAESPTLTIDTPSEVWLKISRGELSGQDALLQGLYTASGDLSLMLKMDALFKSDSDVSYEAPASQRPAGPIPLPGMSWMAVAFIPWMIHWITFDIPGISHWISVGLPLLLSALIIGYRLAFDRPTWMEWGGLGFFTISGTLALTGSPGYTHWGSIISSVVMAALWLSSLQFSKTPLSAEYSKWDFVKALWRNSMFIYPNAVITLVWGWQFIMASFLGIAALLIPEQMLVFTIARYLLQVPAFIFTYVYQKRVLELKVDDYEKTFARLHFWAGLGLSAVSGLLLTAAMPGFDVPFLGWIALVPLLMVISTAPLKQHYPLALPFGLLLSIGVHNWYPNIFPPVLGYFLIFAVGTFYASMLQLGSWLQSRLPGALKLLALPVAWSAVEFVKFIAPVIEDWWFVLLAKSMWRFPPALQVLSLTGFPGLSFLVMLANVALAFLVIKMLGIQNQETGELDSLPSKVCAAGLGFVGLILILGSLSIPDSPSETFSIAALTDMMLQDPDIPGLIKSSEVNERLSDPQRSQDIFDINENLTREIIAAGAKPDFIVWPENKIASMDNMEIMSQISALAQDVNAYIVVNPDKVLGEGQYLNMALMVASDGEEAGQRAKIHHFGDASEHGFQIGSRNFSVFETPYGKVGLGVCYDYHFLDVARGLARNGARILLMPTDDDFDGNPNFPPFHASDGVFRAAEHRVAMGLANTNGLALVIDPYGRITAEGKVNQRGVIIGETFTAPGETLYTRIGDWFGWLMVGMLSLLLVLATRRKKV